jgi:hypothetical protein
VRNESKCPTFPPFAFHNVGVTAAEAFCTWPSFRACPKPSTCADFGFIPDRWKRLSILSKLAPMKTTSIVREAIHELLNHRKSTQHAQHFLKSTNQFSHYIISINKQGRVTCSKNKSGFSQSFVNLCCNSGGNRYWEMIRLLTRVF